MTLRRIDGIPQLQPYSHVEALPVAMLYRYMLVQPFVRSLSAVVILIALLSGCSRSSEPTWVVGWRSAEPLIVPRTGAGAVVDHGHLYAIGGIRGGGLEEGFVKSVEFAAIQPDGSVTGWRLTSPLTVPRGFLKAVTSNGFIYVVGGETYRDGLLLLNTVERAKILPTGSLGPWKIMNPMTTPRRSPAAVISHHFLYAIGGYNGLFLKSVERAAIGPDGSLAPWELLQTSLTTDRYIHGVGHVGDYIYIVGGHLQDVGGGKSSVEWTKIQADGSLAPWQLTKTIKTPRFLASTIASGPFVFTLGGFQDGYLSSVERATSLPNGALSAWADTTPLPRPREGAAAAVAEPDPSSASPSSNEAGRRLYLLGGSQGGEYLHDVEWAVVNDRGELGYWTRPTSSDAPSLEPGSPAVPPPARPTPESAHSPTGAVAPPP
jgi:hypothetical protein